VRFGCVLVRRMARGDPHGPAVPPPSIEGAPFYGMGCETFTTRLPLGLVWQAGSESPESSLFGWASSLPQPFVCERLRDRDGRLSESDERQPYICAPSSSWVAVADHGGSPKIRTIRESRHHTSAKSLILHQKLVLGEGEVRERSPPRKRLTET
jgi:hypothetical protein